MKKIITILFFLFAGFLIIHAQRGRVEIQDGTLVTDKGTLLRGIFIDKEYFTGRYPTKEEITSLKNYGLNCIHFYGENAWEPGNPDAGYLAAYTDSLVSWSEQDSLYLVLSMVGWTPEKDTFVSDYWRFYADRYKDKTHLIFEICNEPLCQHIPYDSLTLVMEKNAYDTIRKYAPDTHIQFMSYPYMYNVDSAIINLKQMEGVDWGNASVAAHGYIYSAEDTRKFITTMQDSGFAITITEIPVIRYKDDSPEFYVNMAFTRIYEEEFVSYIHFLNSYHILDNPKLFKKKIEQSEIRWNPDFGEWPASLPGIDYINPFSRIRAGFYDEDTRGVYHGNKFKIWTIDTIKNMDPHIAFYNLNFEECPDSILMTFYFMDEPGRIEIRLDSVDGPLICNAQVPHVDWETEVAFSYPLNCFTGIHNIYFVFKSNNYFSGILDNIVFLKPGINSKQLPYHGNPFELPCIIEAEDFDIGLFDSSYCDNTPDNERGTYRYDDVDIEPSDDTCQGYNIGWIETGEWLEYTINCHTTYIMDIQFRIACTDPGEKIRIKINDKTLGTVKLPNTYGWQNWETVTLEDIIIPAGDNQILRLEFLDSGFNFNWLNFIAKEISNLEVTGKKEDITFYPNPAKEYIKLNISENALAEIFTIQGQLVKKKPISADNNQIQVSNLPSGNYVVKITTVNNVISEVLIVE